MNDRKRTGIIGGTFDPIHIGHLIAAEWAKEAYHLDKVLFVPAGDPPHKDADRVTIAEHRYVMALLATLDNPDFLVSRVEVDRVGKSFTLHTLRALGDDVDEDEELYFIMGADSLAHIKTWYRPEEILSLCQVIVVTRPTWVFDRIASELGAFYTRFKDRIHRLDIPDLGIASREIRRRVMKGESIKYMTPDLVAKYIDNHGLYVSTDPCQVPTRASTSSGNETKVEASTVDR